jgi:hypothetical protein
VQWTYVPDMMQKKVAERHYRLELSDFMSLKVGRNTGRTRLGGGIASFLAVTEHTASALVQVRLDIFGVEEAMMP